MSGPEPGLTLTWVGHSTVLVEAGGVRVLTDPLLRGRVGHIRRVVPDPRPIEGELDAVLVSHVHWDHLDIASLRQLRAKRWIVPRGAAGMLARRGFEGVAEIEAGEEIALGAVSVRATHAEHEARRYPFIEAKPSLGFLIGRVYFAGDTEVFAGMSELGAVEVALLPIAGWGPRLPAGHMGPAEAVEALGLVRPSIAVPIHWGTYRRIALAADAATMRAPAQEFVRLAAEREPNVQVRVLEPGESMTLA